MLYVFFKSTLMSAGIFNDDAVYVLGARDFFHPSAFHSFILKPRLSASRSADGFGALGRPRQTGLDVAGMAFRRAHGRLDAVGLEDGAPMALRRRIGRGDGILTRLDPLIAKFSGVITPNALFFIEP